MKKRRKSGIGMAVSKVKRLAGEKKDASVKKGKSLVAKGKSLVGRKGKSIKKLVRKISREPEVKEFFEKQAELAKRTLDKAERKVKKKLHW